MEFQTIIDDIFRTDKEGRSHFDIAVQACLKTGWRLHGTPQYVPVPDEGKYGTVMAFQALVKAESNVGCVASCGGQVDQHDSVDVMHRPRHTTDNQVSAGLGRQGWLWKEYA